MKIVTVLFLERKDELLLAMKKRGFGEGKWNGTGGKVEPGERIIDAAIRECQEEIGVTPQNPRLIGKIKFREHTDPDFGHDAHIYIADEWEGDPAETEEMRPQWFLKRKLPFDSMWADDPLWMPYLLQGKLFTATFVLDGNTVHTHTINEVETLTEESS